MSYHSRVRMPDGSHILRKEPGGLWTADKKDSQATTEAARQNAFIKPWMAQSIAAHGPEKPHG